MQTNQVQKEQLIGKNGQTGTTNCTIFPTNAVGEYTLTTVERLKEEQRGYDELCD